MSDNPEGPNNWRDHCARLEGRTETLKRERDAYHKAIEDALAAYDKLQPSYPTCRAATAMTVVLREVLKDE